MSAYDGLILATCHLVYDTLRKVAQDSRHVVSLPGVDIVSVTPVAYHVFIAFRQPDIDPTRTFVWIMEFPPEPTTPALAEAVITENFLEEMVGEGADNWPSARRLDIDRLTFLAGTP